MKPGYKKIELGEMPKEWKLIFLGDVCSLEYGSALRSNERKDGKYPVYGSNGIIGYHTSYNAKGPSIIIGRKGSIGSVHFSEVDCWAIDTTYFIKFKNESQIDIKYFYYYLKKIDLSKLAITSTIPGINREIAYKKQIILPCYIEQHKIATILSDIDEQIEIERQRKQKFETLKKGLMNDLLTGRKRVKI